jgi:hypothetical protein
VEAAFSRVGLLYASAGGRAASAGGRPSASAGGRASASAGIALCGGGRAAPTRTGGCEDHLLDSFSELFDVKSLIFGHRASSRSGVHGQNLTLRHRFHCPIDCLFSDIVGIFDKSL